MTTSNVPQRDAGLARRPTIAEDPTCEEAPDPLVSIVVPVYNTALYLTECLRSLREQTYSKVEIVMVDDGSSDSSGLMCDAAAQSDRRFRVIHQENAGVSTAMNRGVALASGEFIVLVGSDDVLGTQHIERLVRAAQVTAADVALSGFTRFVDSADIVASAQGHANDTKAVFTPDELLRSTHPLSPISTPSPCAKLWPKEYLAAVPFPAGRVHEDAMVTHKLLRRAGRVVVLDANDYFYRVREGSITASPRSARYLLDKALAHHVRACELVGLNAPHVVRIEQAKAFHYLLVGLDAAQRTGDASVREELHLLRLEMLQSPGRNARLTTQVARFGLRICPGVTAMVYAKFLA